MFHFTPIQKLGGGSQSNYSLEDQCDLTGLPSLFHHQMIRMIDLHVRGCTRGGSGWLE